MSKSQHAELIDTILDQYGQTYAEEAGIELGKDNPSALFQLLVAAILLSARIAAGNAVNAAKALGQAGLTTPEKMAHASWQDRVDVLTTHGYKRYDERTASMLGEVAQMLLDRYDGDLRKLREAAGGDPHKERSLLKEFKGIGEVGADIFLREVQGPWGEVYPFADRKVRKAAETLGLPSDPHKLAELVSRRDFPRLVSALVRIDLHHAYDDIRAVH